MWKPMGRLPWIIAAVILLAGAAYALGARQPKVPPLANAYDSLADHLDQLAAHVGADPGQTYLNRWYFAYGPGGTVSDLSMDLIVYDDGGYTWYNYSQRGSEPARLTRSHSGPGRLQGPVPARTLLQELDAAGLESLEAHSGQEPPVRIWGHSTYTTFTNDPGSGIGYDQRVGAHVIANGRITPVGPEGIRLRGGHMWLLIGRSETGSIDNLTYLVPAAVAP